jgi:hypothetical protein
MAEVLIAPLLDVIKNTAKIGAKSFQIEILATEEQSPAIDIDNEPLRFGY